MKKLFMAFLAGAMLVSGAAVADAKNKVFSLGHVNPGTPDDQYMYFCNELNKNLKELTGGKIQFEIFSDSKLGHETELFQGVSDGSVDAAIVSNNIVSGSIPQFQILDLPYFFDSEAEYAALLDSEFFGGFAEKTYKDEWNIHVMSPVLDASYRALFLTGKPVNSLADIKDVKVRVTTNRIHEDGYKALGANPAVIAWGETYTAFQQGVVQGLDVGIPVSATMGFYEVAEYCSKIKPFPILGWPLMNQDVWADLTADEQKAITTASIKASLAQREHQRQMENSFQAMMEKERGIKFNDPDLADFKKATAPVREKYKKEIGDDFYNQSVKVVEDYRKSK